MFEYTLAAFQATTDRALVQVHNAMANSLGPFAMTLLVLYLVLLGYRSYFGSLDSSQLFANVLTASVSCGMLLHPAGFELVRDVAHLPEEVGLVTLKALTGMKGSAGAAMTLDNLLLDLTLGINQIMSHAGVLNIYPILIAVGLLGLVVVFFAYLGYLLVLASILTTVFLSLFPVALALSLIDECKPILKGLIRQTLTYALVPCLVYALLGFTAGLLTEWTRAFVASNGDLSDLMSSLRVFFLLVVNILLLSQVVGAASGIVGGIGMRPAQMPLGLGLLRALDRKP